MFASGCGTAESSGDDLPDATTGSPDAALDAATEADSCPFAAGSQPQKKVVFVDQYPEQDFDIEDEVIDLFRAAVPGSKIRIGLFTWTRSNVAEVHGARAGVLWSNDDEAPSGEEYTHGLLH